MEALKMEREMTHWNDDRLDELNGRVKDGFAKVDERFKQVDERFVRLEGEMKEGFDKLTDRFDRLCFILIAACIGLIGTLFLGVVSLLAQS